MKFKINLFLLTLWLQVFTFTQASGVTIETPLQKKITSIGYIIKTFLEGALTVILPILVLAYIYVGFLFIKAQGEPEEIKKAKTALLDVTIGAILVILGVAFYNIIFVGLKGN